MARALSSPPHSTALAITHAPGCRERSSIQLHSLSSGNITQGHVEPLEDALVHESLVKRSARGAEWVLEEHDAAGRVSGRQLEQAVVSFAGDRELAALVEKRPVIGKARHVCERRQGDGDAEPREPEPCPPPPPAVPRAGAARGAGCYCRSLAVLGEPRQRGRHRQHQGRYVD